jgi:hypothetical protein
VPAGKTDATGFKAHPNRIRVGNVIDAAFDNEKIPAVQRVAFFKIDLMS